MKKFILSLLALIPILSFSQNNNKYNLDFCSNKSEYNLDKFTNTSVGRTYNQYYLRAVWNIDPNQYYISGSTTYYFTMTENSNIMSFDLHDTLNIDSIIFHNTQLTYTRNNNVLEITLPTSINEGVSDSISIYYFGTPTKIIDHFAGIENKTYEYNGVEIPCLWTLSEPYGAKDWFPCKQELYDKLDSIDLYFITPVNYTTAANGILISDDTINGKKITHWKHKYPISTYLIGFVTTEFNENHRYLHLLNNDSIYMMEYYLKNDSSLIEYPYNIENVFNLYDTLFMPYPFKNEKYGHMQWNRGGGMEHQTISSVNKMSWYDHFVIEHELAHQWFGDYITCGSWTDIWLNEGFATFGNFISLKYLWSYYPTWYPNLIKSYHDQIISKPDGSVFVDDTTSVSRVFDGRLTYAKGSFLLRMLNWELGDTDFYNGVRAYLNNENLKYGFARTSDLVNALEQAADTSLTEFFNDWFYGQGYPIYNIEYFQDENNFVNILINQTPSHQSVSFFEMTIPIQFWVNGNDTIVRYKNNSNNQLFGLQLNGEIDSIKFDPNYEIISENTVSQNVNLLDNDSKIKVFPNPTKGELTVSLGNLPLQIENIYITNIQGKQTLLEFKNVNTQKIDISKFVKGIYILTVETNAFTFNKKILKD